MWIRFKIWLMVKLYTWAERLNAQLDPSEKAWVSHRRLIARKERLQVLAGLRPAPPQNGTRG